MISVSFRKKNTEKILFWQGGIFSSEFEAFMLFDWIIKNWEKIFGVFDDFFINLFLCFFSFLWLHNWLFENSFKRFLFDLWLNFFNGLFFFNLSFLLRFLNHKFFLFILFLLPVKVSFERTMRMTSIDIEVGTPWMELEGSTKGIKQLVHDWKLWQLSTMPIDLKWVFLIVLNDSEYFVRSLFWMFYFEERMVMVCCCFTILA